MAHGPERAGYGSTVTQPDAPVAVVCVSCRNATSSVAAGWIINDDLDLNRGLIECSHCKQIMVIAQSFGQDYDGAYIDDGPPTVIWPSVDAP
jgi:hypothetical protein